MELIELREVTQDYGGGALFDRLSLRLAPGSFHFLTGPSGAGKTTFLRICYGDLAPSSGEVQLFQRPLSGMTRDDRALVRRRIGVVHQDCTFLDHLDLIDNVALPLTVSGRTPDAVELAELLAWVGLSAQAHALPPSLSGGERQRAALARAVINSPDLVLADEPTGNVDWDMSMRLLSLLVELNRMGKTIVIATHDLNLIRAAKAQVPARVLRISGRKIQQSGVEL